MYVIHIKKCISVAVFLDLSLTSNAQDLKQKDMTVCYRLLFLHFLNILRLLEL
jgi:hypothetical protein